MILSDAAREMGRDYPAKRRERCESYTRLSDHGRTVANRRVPSLLEGRQHRRAMDLATAIPSAPTGMTPSTREFAARGLPAR